MYALFEAPDDNARLLDRLLAASIRVAMRTNAPDMEQSRQIAEMWQYVQSPQLADTHVKLYTLLFLLNHEPDVQRTVLATYAASGVDDTDARHFIYDTLPGLVQPTQDWSSAPTNIVDNVAGPASLTHTARRLYLTTSSPRPLK